MDAESGPVRAYHDGTKHHFDRYARSLGYLDWASQPKPFRRFDGSARLLLHPAPDAAGVARTRTAPYASLVGVEAATSSPPLPLDLPALGFFLRHALGLSAWKVFQSQRWSLRVNPSSGNLHPTEAYVLSADAVWHYAPDAHELERRCEFAPPPAGPSAPALPANLCVVILTSIHWREAWKYGERAFRYCQHDIGHAIAALRMSAALCGWQAAIADDWPAGDLAALAGIDRDADYIDVEREEPACALVIQASGDDEAAEMPDRAALLDAVHRGSWTGRASRLSDDHVQWTFIDDVAAATRGPVVGPVRSPLRQTAGAQLNRAAGAGERRPSDAATLFLSRRSAVALDGQSSMPRHQFLEILAQVQPTDWAPWDALWWEPRIHLLLFVHRVTGLDPGLYLLPRTASGETLLKRAITRAFTWEPADPDLPLIRLAAGDCRRLAQRLSCDQAIAADGAFSLGMLADFAGSLDEHGASFYRRLFWESGVVGHQLYLAAEAAGLRGTGIGCFFDDAVHDVLGLQGDAIQSLYHFTIGVPVEDRRLTTESGYPWADRGGDG